jgi:microcin C transport system permease protein
MLSLLVFIGEAVRDAFDPRKLFAGEPPPPEPGVAATPPAQAQTQATGAGR